ncbi:hypothetical protein DIS18_10475 [Algibacter marinivivus]|uniref:DUF5362 domain-containing protein n=1 Tax=Algibacter marinivivus TaxID=2100723 RepID=A0A2U2X4H9_9FLAO|nr:DUF5362 family protein [Algibacter marinivivus]PWH82654.1 hypothetical protein DIS18_10475 [Algibacter marinivivus]
MEEKSAFKSFELEVNNEIKGFLKEISKWAYFLSILGFVGIGLMVTGGIGVSFFTGMNQFGGDTAYGLGYSAGVGLFYILFALIYFFPLLYLFKFAKNMKSALKSDNNENFKSAFLNLKSHYKFIGIFTIAIIGLYVIILIGALGTSLF